MKDRTFWPFLYNSVFDIVYCGGSGNGEVKRVAIDHEKSNIASRKRGSGRVLASEGGVVLDVSSSSRFHGGEERRLKGDCHSALRQEGRGRDARGRGKTWDGKV